MDRSDNTTCTLDGSEDVEHVAETPGERTYLALVGAQKYTPVLSMLLVGIMHQALGPGLPPNLTPGEWNPGDGSGWR